MSGMLYGYIVFDRALVGAIYAPFSILPPILFERGLVLRSFRAWTNTLTTPAYLVTKAVCFTGLFLIGSSFSGLIVWRLGIWAISLRDAVVPPVSVWPYGMAVLLSLVAMLRVRELLGRQIFVSVMIGRYRRPIEEQRVFLFVDIVNSTGYAQHFGALAAAAYIGYVFDLIALPVRLSGGSIDDYVGDAVLISWPHLQGTKGAKCLRCALEINRELEKRSLASIRRFGDTPALRSLIHAGSVVTAEVGADHHKITYFGDTINAAGKLQNMIKAFDPGIFITDTTLASIALPDCLISQPLGSFEIRGQDGNVSLSRIIVV